MNTQILRPPCCLFKYLLPRSKSSACRSGIDRRASENRSRPIDSPDPKSSSNFGSSSVFPIEPAFRWMSRPNFEKIGKILSKLYQGLSNRLFHWKTLVILPFLLLLYRYQHLELLAFTVYWCNSVFFSSWLNCSASELRTVLNLRQSTQNQNLFPEYWFKMNSNMISHIHKEARYRDRCILIISQIQSPLQ